MTLQPPLQNYDISTQIIGHFYEWLSKTRMSFYGYQDLDLPWWFAVGCWHFAVAGLVMLWVGVPQWMTSRTDAPTTSMRFPYRTVAFLLILVQSPLSFMADYVHMTNDSYWHVWDRCLAIPLMGMEILKFSLMCHHSWTTRMRHDNTLLTINDCVGNGPKKVALKNKSPSARTGESAGSTAPPPPAARTTCVAVAEAMHPCLIAAYGMAMALAMMAFRQSTIAQSHLDRDGFVFWHNLWHLYPLVASWIALLDFYACDGWKRSTRRHFYAIEWHLIRGRNRSPSRARKRVD